MQAKIHTHAHHTGGFKQVYLTKVTESTEAESMVFLSPLYSLVHEILVWGLNRVIGALPVTSTAGNNVFLLSSVHIHDFKCSSFLTVSQRS